MKKKQVIWVFSLTILAGFLIEVLSPELQALGLSARVIDALGGGITVGGLLFLALNWYKAE